VKGAKGLGLDASDVANTSVVLRVSQEQLDLDACMTWLPSSRIDRVWRAGERHRRGVHDRSGFSVSLAEGPARGSVVQDAVDAFLELAEPVAELVRGGADAEVDFGLFVTSGGSLSLSFAPAAAAVFERAGVTLVVSAYPTSDDDE
jgi:hypothetical protein